MVVRLIIVHICYYTSFGTQSYRFFWGAPFRVGLSLLPSASLRASVLSLAHTATQAPPHHSPTPLSKLLHHFSLPTAHCPLQTANSPLLHLSSLSTANCQLITFPWVSPMAIDIQALRAGVFQKTIAVICSKRKTTQPGVN